MPRRLSRVALAVLAVGFASPSVAQAADTWTTPYAGVRHLTRTTSDPLRIHALVVDLCAPGISVRTTASTERQRTVSSFGKLVGAQAAINGDFFNYNTYGTSGLAIGNNVRWTDTHDTTSSGFVAFGPASASFSHASELVSNPDAWMHEVVSGHAQIVKDGAVISTYDCSGHFCQREPRTAAGMSANRRSLIAMVVDGRTSVSIGVTLAQLGTLMHDVGAHDALNFDGGGSTTMWLASDGVLNAPSDGSERVVANHLAVQAGGNGVPGSCTDDPLEQALIDAHLFDAQASSDVDGDGRADLCARAAAGVRCYLSTGAEVTTSVTGPELSDASGWDDPSNYGTMRLGDTDGDGKADVCARSNAGWGCWPSTGTGFGARIAGPAWADADGWTDVGQYSTIRLLDIDGDGRADVCGRASDGVHCHLSTGDGFGAAVPGPALTDGSGWGKPQYYGTLRAGDVNGDGRGDLCARAAKGMICWLSDGASVQQAIDGPVWSNDAGWDAFKYWSTIRLADIDGDGRDDLCGRSAEGLECHLSTGTGFGAVVQGPTLSDGTGWGDRSNYLTLRMGDVDGDGRADACARANAGMRCWRSTGDGFASSFVGPALSDAEGWWQSKYYDTIRLADIDADGRADLCARGAEGVSCWRSLGDDFSGAIAGPSLSDGSGWGKIQYWSTLRAGGPVHHEAQPDAGVDATVDAPVGDASSVDGEVVDGNGWPTTDAALGAGGGAAAVADTGDSSGCACGVQRAQPGQWAVAIMAFVMLGLRGRRRRSAT